MRAKRASGAIREKERLAARRYYWENRDTALDAARRYASANKAKRAEIQNRRRARLVGATVEPVDPGIVFERDGWVCHICGDTVAPKDASLDHVVPLSLGGEHSYANVATSHLSCNVKKGNRLIVDCKRGKDAVA
jgi:5-methylcytosine-specific restriction endonuclease McrA